MLDVDKLRKTAESADEEKISEYSKSLYDLENEMHRCLEQYAFLIPDYQEALPESPSIDELLHNVSMVREIISEYL